jgi:hypothetical protein
MTPEEISTLRYYWNRLQEGMKTGTVSNVDTVTLEKLEQKMGEAIDLLSIFPETETARYWFCIQRREVQGIIQAR